MSCERLNTAQEDRGSRSRGFGKTSDPSNVLGCEIGDLLGDDEKTVREHYSRWVPTLNAVSFGLSPKASFKIFVSLPFRHPARVVLAHRLSSSPSRSATSATGTHLCRRMRANVCRKR